MLLNDCTHNTDPLKLVREGSSQAQRNLPALGTDYAPVDQRTPAHRMIFARAYAAFLRFFDETNTDAGDWQPFFASDVSVQLAVAAVQDVDHYKAGIKASFDFLDKLDNDTDEAGLKNHLGQLFGSAATVAAQLEVLKEGLPDTLPLKAQLQNLIRKQLAPAFTMLILYHRDGLLAVAPPPAGPYHSEVAPPLQIMGAAWTMSEVRSQSFSKDWFAEDSAADWTAYLARLDDTTIYPDTGIYGSGATLFRRVNHIATHTLFTSVFDRFLKVYARTVASAGEALQASFAAGASHEPHYALLLAFLRLYERLRMETNTLTGRHLDFYYREVLRLKEKGAQPGHAHLLGELARQVPSHLLESGTLVRAGKDALGKDAFYAVERDTVLNQASVAALHTVYRHDAEAVTGAVHTARLFASPVANSSDGIGGELEGDMSWHPFHNKRYQDGALAEVRMPQAAIGFALASHYLLLAEGVRDIRLDFTLAGAAPDGDLAGDALCMLTTADGWLEKNPVQWTFEDGVLRLDLSLDGADPSITPYVEKVHGGRFSTTLPVLQVVLRHRPAAAFPYARLQDVVLASCALQVSVTGLKSLGVSNDFGPVDTSKPFQPYGAMPVENSALTIGSREMFQKTLSSASVHLAWHVPPDPYNTTPQVAIDFLKAGQWEESAIGAVAVATTGIELTESLDDPVRDHPDLAQAESYSNAARHGFMRLRLDDDFGHAQYQKDLIAYLSKVSGSTDPGSPPVAPVVGQLTLDYVASQSIVLNSADEAAFTQRAGRFFHVAPFGQAEQHPRLNSAGKVNLLPQFVFPASSAGTDSGGELYIGLAALQPPQNLSLLMEVAPGTADPLAKKPQAHVQWSYLRANEWVAFAGNEVNDGTVGLLSSGVVTLSVPRDASAVNTVLAPGMHWIRVAVASRVDAACRLLMVAAQALEATFADQGNDPAFSATVLPAGAITKLAAPDAAVKQLSQPFSSFGGRGAEAPADFYTRISERLRHKDRAIALWDYEHLVLEAFPQIYKAKCLNHTQYEPDDSGAGIYRELAPGHVTIVTIPNQQFQNLRDPLRPYTSLDLLQQIETCLRRRAACFVRLHVRNPQFEEVRLAFKVRLFDGVDESYHVNLLKEEITRFLSPWAFPGGASPSFGGKVSKSGLINFVEERPYVDYVTDFQLFHDIGGVLGTVDLNEVAGSLAVSILVSVPAKRHAIEVLHPLALAGAAEHCPCEAS